MGEENRATAGERCFPVYLGACLQRSCLVALSTPCPRLPGRKGEPAIHTAMLRGVCQGLSLPPLL